MREIPLLGLGRVLPPGQLLPRAHLFSRMGRRQIWFMRM